MNGQLPEAVRNQHYHTDPIRWTCACHSFLNSRFLLCKHILSCYEPVCNRIDFFRSVQRHREPPFWTHRQLVLQPQYQSSLANTKVDKTNDIRIDEDEDIDPVVVEQDQLVNPEEEENVEADGNKFALNMQIALDIFREQQAKGNEKFEGRFMAMYTSIETLVEEVKELEHRRSMRRTWDARKHPLTMYYN